MSNKLTYLNSEVNPIRLYAYTLTITCFLRACIRMERVKQTLQNGPILSQ